MFRYFALALLALTVAGCASYAATSGRVVIQNGNDSVDVRINERDRQIIQSYYRNGPRQKALPPGLAKRNDLPPGLAKRDRLPPGLATEPLPSALENRLSSLPVSYVRVRVGRDVVLMNRQTHVVFDIVYGVAP